MVNRKTPYGEAVHVSGWQSLWAVLLAGILLGCVRGAYAAPGYPELDGATATGRSVWIQNCENCHAYGVAGSPNPLEPEDWSARLKKEMSLLYQHAIDGFFGPDDTYMPARGGNDSLTDDEVRAAVDYMVALARYNAQIQQEKEK